MGHLEEIVLMILLKYNRCHGVEIAQHYEEVLARGISLPAIHVVLKRMEKKGWVESEFGEPSAKRGGRRKRYYWATASGYYAVKAVQDVKLDLWQGISPPNFKYGI
jgi:PadR family transcriptional regulator PadR